MAYIKFILIALFITNVCCDELQLDSSKTNILTTAACVANCLNINSSTTFVGCFEMCQTINQTTILKETNIRDKYNDTIRLICRESNSLTIGVGDSGATRAKDELYLIRLEENQLENPNEILLIANEPIITITNLTHNTEFNVTVSIFNGRFEHRRLSETKTFKTFATKDYVPLTIPSSLINIEYLSKNDSLLPHAIIHWKSVDFVCNFMFGLFSSSDSNVNHIWKLDNPKKIYTFGMVPLKYSNEYKILLRGLNLNSDIEGPATELVFRAPSCYSFHNFNFSRCVPLRPINVTTHHEYGGKDFLYNIVVAWNKPTHFPDLYNISIFSKTTAKIQKIINGTETYVRFNGVQILDSNYDLRIIAISKAGQRNYFKWNISLLNVIKTTNNNLRFQSQIINPIVLFSVPILSLIFILILCLCNRKNIEMLSEKEKELRKLAKEYHKDAMEIKESNVQMEETLGEGAFGIVKRAILKPSNRVVAVKMLKESAGVNDVDGFLREIALMKTVDHVNVVGIVGHCTLNYNNMMLLTEYCSEGNLLDYLRYFYKNGTMTQKPIDSYSSICFNHPIKGKAFDEKYIKNRIMNEILSVMILDKDINLPNCVNNRIYDEELGSMYSSDPDDIGIQMKSISNSERTVDEGIVSNRSSMTDNADNQNNMFYAENRGYDLMNTSNPYLQPIQTTKFNENEKAHNSIGSVDLLEFARQVAVGMAHLSEKKIVHRDLAARNVLVCADKTVKIADFGLSRDIYVDNIYFKSTAGRIPIKWLALESIAEQEYTTKSDVWSFGVLLFEIMTLGCTPYPGILAEELPTYLRNDKRLEKPKMCSNQFYELMLSCWHIKPDYRPSFNELTIEIDKFTNNCKNCEAFTIDIKTQTEITDQLNVCIDFNDC